MTKILESNYLDLLAAIKDFIAEKMMLIDMEASLKNSGIRQTEREVNLKLFRICDAGEFISTMDSESRSSLINLNGALADLLEKLYQLIIDERTVKEKGTKDEKKMILYTLMSEYRKLLTLADALTESINLKCEVMGEYILDNRLEMVLIALKRDFGFKSLVKKEYRLCGFTLNLGFIFTSLLAIGLLAFITAHTIELVSRLLEMGGVAKSIYIDSWVFSFLHVMLGVEFFGGVINGILTKIYVAYLKRRAEEGNVSARYVAAFYYIAPFSLTVFTKPKVFIYEIMQCAEEGYPPALYELGKIYETGRYSAVKPNMELAMKYYSRAAVYYDKACVRYNELSRKL